VSGEDEPHAGRVHEGQAREVQDDRPCVAGLGLLEHGLDAVGPGEVELAGQADGVHIAGAVRLHGQLTEGEWLHGL
jgi:hypothetical protein